jgi:hypothetical protein
LLGTAIRQAVGDKIIATSASVTISSKIGDEDATTVDVAAEIERQKSALGVSVLDVVMIHHQESYKKSIQRKMRAELCRQVEQGNVRALGVSGGAGGYDELMKEWAGLPVKPVLMQDKVSFSAAGVCNSLSLESQGGASGSGRGHKFTVMGYGLHTDVYLPIIKDLLSSIAKHSGIKGSFMGLVLSW